MKRLSLLAQRLIVDRRGATVIEYGLIMALVFLAIMMTMFQMADGTVSLWKDVAHKILHYTADAG